MINSTSKLLIVLTILLFACNQQKNDVSQQSNTTKTDTTNYRPPKVVKVNKDSLPVFTPGENGVPLPKVVKAGEPEITYIKNLPIIPGESYLPQTKEEIAAGKKPILSKKPNKIIINKDSLRVNTPGKNGLKLPTVYKIYQPNSPELIDKTYTIQHGDTIYPPIVRYYPYPKEKPALPPSYKDHATRNIYYLSIGEGVSYPDVHAVMQDKNGNIWLATNMGLSKYDGKTFTNFTNENGFDIVLISCLYEDKEGNIWFGSNGLGTGGNGLLCYDGQSFMQFTTKQGLANNNVTSIIEDKSGNIWIGTMGGGMSCYDGESVTNYTNKQGLISNYILSIIEDKNGELWFGTWRGGVSCYNGKSFTNYTNKDGLNHSSVVSIVEDKAGNIWFGKCCGAVSRYDGKSFTNYGLEQGLTKGHVRTIVEDNDGNIWFGNRNGATCFDGKSFTHITTKEGLSNNNIASIIEDKAGKLWFGTIGGGVNVYDRKSFNHFNFEKGFNDYKTDAIFEDKSGKLWFGFRDQGLMCYDGNSIVHYTTKQGLISNWVTAVEEDNYGNIWIGTSRGLCSFDGNSFTHYTKKEGLSDNHIWNIFKDKNGIFWIAGEGVCSFDGKSFTHFTTKQGFNGNTAFAMHQDKKGRLWFGTFMHGVSCYDGISFTHYKTNLGSGIDWVGAIHEDINGTIWVGTLDGLNYFNGHSFKRIGTEQGLSNNTVTSFIENKNTNLWIGTMNGLNCFVNNSAFAKNRDDLGIENEKKAAVFYNFRKLDGLKGLHCWEGSVTLDSKNRYWFATQKTVSMLDMNQFELPKDSPKIYLSTIHINEHFIDFRLLKDTVLSHNNNNKTLAGQFNKDLIFDRVADFYNYPINLQLPYKLNHLTFHFSAIDWAAPHKLQYKYKLQGLDKQWSSLSTENKADYRNIPYGEYIFQVKAIGIAKKWSNTFEYSFIIHPPWWHTWWARIFYLIIFLLFIWSLIRWRTAKLKLDKKKLEHQVKERTTEVENQKEEIEEKNEELSQQNEELSNQKEELSQQNEEIQSINTTLNEQKGLIEERNEELNQQKDEIQTTLEHLKQSQSQLVQSEKMAALGKLIAGIAHEVNTPLGAINSSVTTITESMKHSYKTLPELFNKLPDKLLDDFIALLDKSFSNNTQYTSSEERKFRKSMTLKLEGLNIKNADEFADTLIDIGIYENVEPFTELLKDDKYSEILLDAAYNLSIQYKNSLNIKTAVNKASKVVFALKNYSRYSNAELKVSANIIEGIETVLTLYHHQLKHGIEIKKNFDTIPEISCFPDELNQVWTNLIHNSIYAMPEKGILEIYVQKLDTNLLVKIKDNGTGIAAEIQDKVFDAFFTTKPTGEGSGLGLDIVKKIIEKHNGSIDFESEEGKGTEFRVVLPIGNSH